MGWPSPALRGHRRGWHERPGARREQLGAAVTGSDRAAAPPTARLREAGIEPVVGHARPTCPGRRGLVYSTAVPPETPSGAAAEREARDLHRAELLAEVTRCGRRSPSRHAGKTTTASMLVHTLRGAARIAYLVGGEGVRRPGVNAGWGRGEVAGGRGRRVRPLAPRARPRVAVLTSAELDHHATYASSARSRRAFREFLDAGRGRGGGLETGARAVALADGGLVVPFDAPVLVRRLALRLRRRPGRPPRARRPQRAQRRRRADASRARRRLAAAAAALATSRAAGRRSSASARRRRGARRRRLRPPPDARSPPRSTPPARSTPARDRRLPAAPVLAHEHLARGVRRRAGGGRLAVVLDVYPARERAEDFPGVSGLLVAEARRRGRGGQARAWLPSTSRRRRRPPPAGARGRPRAHARGGRHRRAREGPPAGRR